jgi:Uma2 family endonuclease
MPIATHPMTYEELFELPNDGKRYEIHDGELIVAPSPDWHHQDAISELFLEMATHVRKHVPGGKVYTAPLDVRLSPHNVYQPDIIYISPERRHILRETMPLEGAPDLVVEVLSPSTRSYDQRQKARAYAGAGVREFWLVDPDARSIEVLALRANHYEPVASVDGRAVSLVLPGFSVDPAAIFAGLG